MPVRSYQEDVSFIDQIDSVRYRINRGFVPNMNVSSV